MFSAWTLEHFDTTSKITIFQSEVWGNVNYFVAATDIENSQFEALLKVLCTNQYKEHKTNQCKQAFLSMFSQHQVLHLTEYVPKVILGHSKEFDKFLLGPARFHNSR